MAVSLVLVAGNNQGLQEKPLEIDGDELAAVIDEFAESYLDTLESYRDNDDEAEFYFSAETTKGKLQKFLEKTEHKGGRKAMLAKWSEVKDGSRRFLTDHEELTSIDQPVRDLIENAMPGYRATLTSGLSDEGTYFAVKDITQRIRAGTGSVGAARYYVLIEGRSTGHDDDRILDVKEQSGPTAYYFLGAAFQNEYRARFTNHAQRHAIAYRALTVRTDDHLGWMQIGEGVYSVRERSPYTETYETTKLNKVAELIEFAGYWGAVLATAHARADQDDPQDDGRFISYSLEQQVGEATDGKHKEFRHLVRDIAFDFARRVEADYNRFVAKRKPDFCDGAD